MQIIKAPIRHILMIDDDQEDCLLFGQAMLDVDPGIELSCIHSCDELAAAIQLQKPDLIFLDINIPRIDGFSCLKLLQESITSNRIPIVMYSSSSNPKEINIAYGLGATLYLKKPSRYNDLRQGLQGIFNMAWEEPGAIKQQYFRDGRYMAYKLEQ